MSFKTIQDKINDAADMELHGLLCKAFKALRDEIQMPSTGYMRLKGIDGGSVTMTTVQVLDRVQRAAFDRHQDAYRKKHTDGFLLKIDGLTATVEQMEDALSDAHDKGKI